MCIQKIINLQKVYRVGNTKISAPKEKIVQFYFYRFDRFKLTSSTAVSFHSQYCIYVCIFSLICCLLLLYNCLFQDNARNIHHSLAFNSSIMSILISGKE